MFVGLCISVGIKVSTLVDLQALPRLSVCPLTGCALLLEPLVMEVVPMMVLQSMMVAKGQWYMDKMKMQD